MKTADELRRKIIDSIKENFSFELNDLLVKRFHDLLAGEEAFCWLDFQDGKPRIQVCIDERLILECDNIDISDEPYPKGPVNKDQINDIQERIQGTKAFIQKLQEQCTKLEQKVKRC